MSDAELEKSVDGMNDLEQELAASPEKALAFLVEAGIATVEGQLTEPYQKVA